MLLRRDLGQRQLSFFFSFLLFLASFADLFPSTASAQTRYGEFSGTPVVELLNGRNVKLKEDFYFRDDKGVVWFVIKGFVSDGASIPQAFWSFIGGPLDGAYRDAAIVHDYFCDKAVHAWQEVHLMFYKGLLARNIDSRKAWVMYKAVYHFGPRWRKVVDTPANCSNDQNSRPEDCILNSTPRTVMYKIDLTKENFSEFLRDIESQGYLKESKDLQDQIKF